MIPKSRILVVEDDAGIRQSLFETLGALGFAVGEAHNGEDAFMRLRMVDYDAVLLDINMPGMGGKEACKRMAKSFPGLPIIMLTVRDEQEDIVEALDSGATDYMTKPFQIGELTARIRAAIRRRSIPPLASDAPLIVGALVLDPNRRRVEKSGEELHLSPKEYETLRVLMEHAGRPVRHDQLLHIVWGPAYGQEREYLRVIVNQLRKKIEDDPARPAYILTDSTVGYRFRDGG
jgi:two-component system KDP operon response regulator KdpE